MKIKNMFKKKLLIIIFFTCSCSSEGGSDMPNRQKFSELGRKIFFDTNLSSTKEMSCASCHSPNSAFSDPSHKAVSDGAVVGRKGNRNAPSVMYAAFSPLFLFSTEEEDYVGGQFWDGFAKDLESQARRPFFKENEMDLKDPNQLLERILESEYIDELKSLYGEKTFTDPQNALAAISNAISAFENSRELMPFASKFDAWSEGKATLNAEEKRGLELFNAPNKGNCAACHPSTNDDGSNQRALFTDFTYDNIGLPNNKTEKLSPDIGLYSTTGRPADLGRFKVPSLRNVAATAPYFHNGVFNSLEEVVHFYNSRDIDSNINVPEFASTMNIQELGNLGLTKQEEEDIVAFLRTLTDGYLER